MELEEFTHKFSECFSADEGLRITASTEFRKLEEWGSMMALIVIAMIDSDYGKTITAEDLREAKTVAHLFDTVSRK